MASLSDHYIINVKFNNREIEPNFSEISFSISDSIYQLYARAYLEVKDRSGLFQEYLAFLEGSKFEIEFGDKDTTNKCSYIALQSELPQTDSVGLINGTVQIPLIHEWYNEQQILSKGYKDRISLIIRDLADKYGFSETNIDDTGNEDYWLQTLQTDANFIENTLLPNAFSRNASLTPFYCYTTSNNEFHFRNYVSMRDEKLVATIEYKEHTGDINPDITLKGLTQSIRKWRDKSQTHWKLKNRYIFKINTSDGSLIEEEDNINQHPQKGGWNIPILNDLQNKTGYLNLLFDESTTGRKENLNGQKFYSMKDGMVLEHFLFFVPLDPTIHAGNSIQLNIYVPIDNKSKLSTNFSGKYIVEDCEHIWNGEKSQGLTKLIVGRKYIQVSGDYILKEALYE